MVVSGVPKENGIRHASEIASMALDLVSVCQTFRIPHKPNTQLRIRAGIHSGMRVGKATTVVSQACKEIPTCSKWKRRIRASLFMRLGEAVTSSNEEDIQVAGAVCVLCAVVCWPL